MTARQQAAAIFAQIERLAKSERNDLRALLAEIEAHARQGLSLRLTEMDQ